MSDEIFAYAAAAIALTALVLINVGYSDPDGACRTLDAQGYKDGAIVGRVFFGCGQGDIWHTEFKAKGPTGAPVTGVVCSGVFKGSTVRIF